MPQRVQAGVLYPLSVDKTPSDLSKANSAAMKSEIQVDSFLKLDRAVKNQTSDDSHEVAPIEYFLFRSTGGPSAGCA
jgi:hypothetical protein